MSQKTPNENTDYTNHAASNRRPAEEQCALDGFKLWDPVRAQCGHVYCRLCLRDLQLSAALCSQTAVCKVCGQHLVEAQSHGAYDTAATGDGSFQEQASRLPVGTTEEQGGPTPLWTPQPRRASGLLREHADDNPAEPTASAAEDTVPSQGASAFTPEAVPQDEQPLESFADRLFEHNSIPFEGAQDLAADDVNFDSFLNDFDLDQNRQFERELLLWNVQQPGFGDFASLLTSAVDPGQAAEANDTTREYTHPFDIDMQKQYTPSFSFMAPVVGPSGGRGLESSTPPAYTAPSALSAHPSDSHASPVPFNAPIEQPVVDPSIETYTPQQRHTVPSTTRPSDITSSAIFNDTTSNHGFQYGTPRPGHTSTPADFTPALTFASPFTDAVIGPNTPQQVQIGLSQYSAAGYTPPSAFLTPEPLPTDYSVLRMVEPQTTLREQVIHVLKQDNLIPTQPLLPSQSFDFTTPHLPPTYHSSAHLHPVPPPQAPIRDISILAGERFCFKGVLKHEDEMKAAVLANGGAVTGGGFKHTTYGVVGGKWKPTRSWETNGIVMLSEDGFWELLYRKTEEARVRKESIRLKGVGT